VWTPKSCGELCAKTCRLSERRSRLCWPVERHNAGGEFRATSGTGPDATALTNYENTKGVLVREDAKLLRANVWRRAPTLQGGDLLESGGLAEWFPSNYDDVVMGKTLAEMRSAHAAALDRALETAIDNLAELPEVEKVIVFGSYQRGRRDLLTDLDLLVIMRSSESFLPRTERLYRLLGGKMRVDFDLVAYSPEEIAQNASNPFLKRALEEGRVVYERPG